MHRHDRILQTNKKYLPCPTAITSMLPDRYCKNNAAAAIAGQSSPAPLD